ncbi:MAG: hypothetical protein H7843_01885 [Nitrospirota bacterium]
MPAVRTYSDTAQSSTFSITLPTHQTNILTYGNDSDYPNYHMDIKYMNDNYFILEFINKELKNHSPITRSEMNKGEFSPAKIASVLYSLTNKTDPEKSKIINVSPSLQRKWRTEEKCQEKYLSYLHDFTSHVCGKIYTLSDNNLYLLKTNKGYIKDINPNEFSMYNCTIIDKIKIKLKEMRSSTAAIALDLHMILNTDPSKRPENLSFNKYIEPILQNMDSLYFSDCLAYFSRCPMIITIAETSSKNLPLKRYLEAVMNLIGFYFNESDTKRRAELEKIIPMVISLAKSRLENFSITR